MKNEKVPPSNKRKYPPFWERFIPIAIGIIIFIIILLLIISITVALGLFPF